MSNDFATVNANSHLKSILSKYQGTKAGRPAHALLMKAELQIWFNLVEKVYFVYVRSYETMGAPLRVFKNARNRLFQSFEAFLTKATFSQRRIVL